MYDRGTIFSNNIKKVAVFESFYIIFIDDSEKNLKSVQETCAALDSSINFVGIY